MCAWGFRADDPATPEADNQPLFDAEPWEWQELDLVLVGGPDGPVTQLVYAALDCNPDTVGPVLVPDEAVRKCAERLHRISPSQFAPLEKFVADCLHSFMPGGALRAYEEAIRKTQELRAFIESAMERGHRLWFWVAA